MAEARQKVKYLTGMRDEISKQLSTASWLLTEAIGNVQATHPDQPDDLPEQIPAQRQITPDSQDHHTVTPA
ncbi:MAG: hypothetical protein GEV09_15940 [Pseudonocardiaceae bacterium]|nr:hypothetical protein [Pseudonocardiaceae bacterium]